MHLTRRGKRRLLVLVAIFAIITVAAGALYLFRDAYRTRLAAKSRAEGLAAYEAGDYEQALVKLQYPLSRNRNDVEALLAFAASRTKISEVNNAHLQQAAGLYQEVLRLDPDNVEALQSLLSIYARVGYVAKATEIIDRLLELRPDDVDVLAAKFAVLRNEMLAGDEPDEDPEPIVQHLIGLEPDRINWYKFQLELMRLRSEPPEDMIALCDQWIKGYEGDGRFYVLKAEVLLGLGRYDDSRTAVLAAAEEGAESLEVLDLMLSVFDTLRLRTQSDETLDAAQASVLERTRETFPSDPWVYVAMIHQQWRAGDYEAAQATLDEAEAALGGLGDELLRWKVLLASASEDQATALEALDRLDALSASTDEPQRDANRAWSQAMRARLTVESAGWPAVIDRLNQAMEANARDPVLLYLLGEAYQNVEENELAVKAFLRAIDADQLWVAPYTAASRSLLALGRPRTAIGVLAGMLRRSPNASAEAYVLLAQAWIASGQPVTAPGILRNREGREIDLLSMLKSLHEQTGGHPQVTRLLAEAYLAAGDRDAAVALAQAEIDREPANVNTLVALADVSRQSGLGLERALLDRAAEVGNETPAVAAAQAQLLESQGRRDEARAALDEAVESAPDNAARRLARRNRAAFLAQINDPEAAQALAGVLDDSPDSNEAALFVVSTATAWRNQALVERAIEQLARTAGEQSPRVVIARANATLRFHADNPEMLATALSHMSDVLALTPDSLPALTLMSDLLMAGDQPDPSQAERYLQMAVDRYPTMWSLYPRLIQLLQDQGDFDTADTYLKQFAQRTEDASTLRQAELKLLEVQGDFETLMVRLRDTLDPASSIDERLMLADLYRRTGRYDDAEQSYATLVAQAPDDERVVAAAADFLADRDQFDRATALIDGFDAPDDPGAKERLRGAFLERQGRVDGAREAYQRALDAAPDDVQTINRLARLDIETGSPKPALALIERGLSGAPDDESLREAQALALLRLDPASQQKAFDIIQSLGPDRADWLETERLNIRMRQREKGPTSRDLADARDLVARYNRYLPAWRLAVTMYGSAGMLGDAVQLSRRAASNLPQSAEPMKWATQLLVRSGQLEQALATARQWRERSLSDPIDADVIISSLLLDLGRDAEALEQLAPHESRIEHDIALAPARAQVWLRALLHNGRLDRAASALAESDKARELWYTLIHEVDAKTAYEALELAEARRGDTPREAYLIANEWAQLGRRANQPAYAERAEALLTLAETDANLAIPVLVVRASIAAGRGDLDGAEGLYRRALQLAPDNAGVLNNLAYSLLMRDSASPEALVLSARAVQLVPNNADLLDTHATALLGANRLDDAAAAATRAIELRPGDPTPYITMAKIRLAQGQEDEAAGQLQRARRLLEAMPQRDESLWNDVEELERRLEQKAASAAS